MKIKIINMLQNVCKSFNRAILFGSAVTSILPNDIDIIFVYKSIGYSMLKKEIELLQNELSTFLEHVPLHITLLNEKEALSFPFYLLPESTIEVVPLKDND